MEKITISKKEYLKLSEAYKKMGDLLFGKKKKHPSSGKKVKSLYGIWKGVKVNEEDFKGAKKSLFKTSSM